MPVSGEITEALVNTGFTSLEADISVYLLQHSPATRYKLAKGIGRSFTNTYKALAGLQTKGAILVDESEHKLSRAVPIEELMDQLEARFREKRRIAVEAVRELPSHEADNRIYHLASVDQVYERCRRMLQECQERVLLELFPEPCTQLRDPVEAVAARGITVAARVYDQESLRQREPENLAFAMAGSLRGWKAVSAGPSGAWRWRGIRMCLECESLHLESFLQFRKLGPASLFVPA